MIVMSLKFVILIGFIGLVLGYLYGGAFLDFIFDVYFRISDKFTKYYTVVIKMDKRVIKSVFIDTGNDLKRIDDINSSEIELVARKNERFTIGIETQDKNFFEYIYPDDFINEIIENE